MSEQIWINSGYYQTGYIYTDDEIIIVKQLPSYSYLVITLLITFLLLLRALALNSKNVLATPVSFLSFAFVALFLAVILASPVVYFLSYLKRRKLRSKSITEVKERKGVVVISWLEVKKLDCRSGTMTIYLEDGTRKKTRYGYFSNARKLEELVRSKSNFPWRIRKIRIKLAGIGCVCFVLFLALIALSESAPETVNNWIILASILVAYGGLGLICYGVAKLKVETNNSMAWKSRVEDWVYKKALEQYNAEKDLNEPKEEHDATRDPK